MRAPGFTLLETLVVLLVVALAATALPRLWGAGQGGLVRAAQLCGLALSRPAQERGARIEEAALEVQRHRGGTPARDAFLRSMAPPHFEPKQREHDRAAWCAEKRPAMQRMDGMLNSTEGTELVQRAEAAEASLP